MFFPSQNVLWLCWLMLLWCSTEQEDCPGINSCGIKNVQTYKKVQQKPKVKNQTNGKSIRIEYLNNVCFAQPMLLLL